VWEEATRGLDGAPGKLRSAQDGIPALEEDLDVAEGERGNLRGPVGRSLLGFLPFSLTQELRSSKAELLRLYGELQVLQGATEERGSLRLAHEKLLQENGRLEAKVSGRGCSVSRLSCPEFPARVKMWEEDQMPDQGADGQPVW
uniref:Uncharacterized protein n=1 Tax=Pseudonaja textilis TaxID=8673 RepID=A0A670ZIJ5_PSETE